MDNFSHINGFLLINADQYPIDAIIARYPSPGLLVIKTVSGTVVFRGLYSDIINASTGLPFTSVNEIQVFLRSIAGGSGNSESLLGDDGKIKPEYLSDINITSLFNSSQIAKVNGVLTIINVGSAKRKPLAPTNITVDDENNLLGFTNPEELTALDTEISINGNITINTQEPAPVGDLAVPQGEAKIRYKETPDRFASDWAVSPKAFTASQGSDPDAGFTPMTTKGNGTTDNVTLAGNRINYLFDSAKPNDFGYYVSDKKLPAGGVGTIRWDVANDVKSMWAGVSPGAQGQTDTGIMFPILGAIIANYGVLLAIVRSSGGNAYVKNKPSDDSYTVLPRMQIRLTGLRVYIEYSLDGGFTWTEFDPETVLEQPQVPLYIKGYATETEAANLSIKGMLQKGFA